MLFTVATAAVAETHALLAAAVPEPISCVVKPTHADNVPVILGGVQSICLEIKPSCEPEIASVLAVPRS